MRSVHHPMPQGYWTRERIIEAIQEYHRRYGRTPRAVDWNVGMARAKGREDLVQQFYLDGCWPHTGNVHGSTGGFKRPFRAWNDAIAAAGFEPRRVGKYDRGQVTA